MCGSTGRRVVGPAETTRRGTISPVPATPHDLVESLTRLAEAVEGLDLRAADVLGHQDVAINRDRISGAVRDYLIPRLEQPEAPLVVVFAGPTGSGKSTLVNSLTGLDLTVAGAIRPTTARPLVLAGDLAHGEAAKGDGEAQVVLERLLAVLRGAAGDPPQGDARDRLLARGRKGLESLLRFPR